MSEGAIEMLVLKEAFRYQNLLDNYINEALYMLQNENFIISKKQIHNRKKVNKDAENEEIDITYDEYDFTPGQLIDFLVSVVDEKSRLTEAITTAKRKMDIDIDSTIAMNRVRQRCLFTFVNMMDHKTNTIESQGTDFKFNENGDQVKYVYPMTVVSKINFDRNDVRNLSRKWRKESDDLSMKLDLLEVTTEVDFTPKWDFDDSLEDAIKLM